MKDVVVVVPWHKNELSSYERLSIDNLFSVLKDREIVAIAPKSLSVSDDRFSEVISVDDRHFTSVANYNRLLVSSDFYRLFSRYSYILIHQFDALVVRDYLDYWVDKSFDYIGGLWERSQIEKYENVSWPYMDRGCGNGGLSLRKVSSAISILAELESRLELSDRAAALLSDCCKLNSNYPFCDHEDIFWCTYIPEHFQFKLASWDEALQFSFEYNPQRCFEMNDFKLPFGAHAWFKYPDSIAFWKKYYFSNSSFTFPV